MAEESIFLTRGIASEEYPRTRSTRVGSRSICFPSSLTFPAPKMIRVAVANSKEDMILYLNQTAYKVPRLCSDHRVSTAGVAESFTNSHPPERHLYI